MSRNTTDIKVVIAIPTKDRHQALDATLERATNLGIPIIICDQTRNPYPGTGPIETLHRPKLAGLPQARNCLLNYTKAYDWVIFIDDDTDLAPDFITQLQLLHQNHPEVDAWGPVVETRSLWQRRLHRLAQLGFAHDPRRLTAGPCDRQTSALFGCCFAVRRTSALQIGGFDTSRPGYALGEDHDFFIRLHTTGHRIRFSSRLRAVHREERQGRADHDRRGRSKVEFLMWLARQHGRSNPLTILHLWWAIIAMASGRGREPASVKGVWSGLRNTLLRS